MPATHRKFSSIVFLSTTLLLAVAGGYLAAVAGAADNKPSRLFEMRTYTAADGKLAALHPRFRNHTNRLFIKHGIELIGYWTPVDGEAAHNTLIYILAYPDRAARDKSWQAVLNDPEWKQAHAESEKDGKLVTKVESKFLSPTDYSPIR